MNLTTQKERKKEKKREKKRKKDSMCTWLRPNEPYHTKKEKKREKREKKRQYVYLAKAK